MDWGGRLVAVRVNDADHPVGPPRRARGRLRAGGLDAIILPKVTSPAHVVWLDLLLGQIEREAGLDEPAGCGIEAQIEDARGLANVNDDRGNVAPAAGAGVRPGQLHGQRRHPVAARRGRSPTATSAPTPTTTRCSGSWSRRALTGCRPSTDRISRSATSTAFRRSAASSAALGYDGKWVLHPAQIEAANQAFAPSADDYSRAVAIIEAYSHATTVDQRGAVMLGDEMIDEASRKMAEAIVARGKAAGLVP